MSNVVPFRGVRNTYIKNTGEYIKDYELALWQAIQTGDIEKMGKAARSFAQVIELFEPNKLGGVK